MNRLPRILPALIAATILIVVFSTNPQPAHAGLILARPMSIGLSSGLVGWWTFNESDMAGNGADDNLYCLQVASNSTTLVEVCTPNGTLRYGEWVHVVGVFRPSGFLRLYVDGAQVAELTSGIPSSQFDSSQSVELGARTSTTAKDLFFEGAFDDVRIYNRALSPDEIKRLYNGGR